ncbi:protein of unknown function [Nitrospira japonica]|uniref:Uncharacterized protein n=1 Tax=Nitrospira japonica TaxID=1325564 RepID=A0A1W1I8A8_9BACT|nr:sigma factor-like helix-turn-helix DNA-binding protein [Nitrospira japonica]SLM49236.1 protein of unknown function [Nitrospira japonica]
MAIRGRAASEELKQERCNRWRLLIRNDAFRTDLIRIIRRYAKWVTGPALAVVLYLDGECINALLERKDAFLRTYRILDHGDKFLLDWAKFTSEHNVAFPEQIIEDIRLGQFPPLEPVPAPEWDALGQDDSLLPPAWKLLSTGLHDIPSDWYGVLLNRSYPKSLVMEALRAYLPMQTKRSRRDKAEVRLRLHDTAVKNRRAVGRCSTTRSRLKAATVAIGNTLPCSSQDTDSEEEPKVPEAPRDEQQDIADALSRLSAEQRRAFEAVYRDGLTEQAYARQVGRTVEYVKLLVQSARAQLRVFLETQGYEAPQDEVEVSPLLAPGCRRKSYRRSFDTG